MKPPPLQRHVSRFDERNDFACAVLGARRLARAYAELVESQKPDAATNNEGPPTDSDYLLLGLYSVARTIGELSDAWTLPVAAGQEPAAAPRLPKLGLLR